ncbi:hypothetical protein [Variovorax sp. V213]|jgi:hypothetical protein|uniref:hypothetical protein n=1 Tax=Variovorax sp. V213 TaxID=3065955 RepID=UPI0034E86BE3
MTVVPTHATQQSGGNLVSTPPFLLYVPATLEIHETVETWFPRQVAQRSECGVAMPQGPRKGACRGHWKSRFPTLSTAHAAPRSVHHG